jgi:hypothetical protein
LVTFFGEISNGSDRRGESEEVVEREGEVAEFMDSKVDFTTSKSGMPSTLGEVSTVVSEVVGDMWRVSELKTLSCESSEMSGEVDESDEGRWVMTTPGRFSQTLVATGTTQPIRPSFISAAGFAPRIEAALTPFATLDVICLIVFRRDAKTRSELDGAEEVIW